MANNKLPKDKRQVKYPKGMPICRVFVYRTNKNNPTNPDSLPVHQHAPLASGDTPWYCVLGWSKDLAPDAESLKNKMYTIDETCKAALLKGRSDPRQWEVMSAKVNLVRAWSCSMATVQIARPYDRDDNAYSPPIRPEDVIVIEMGYTDSMISKKARYDQVFYGIVDNVKERGGSGDNDGITVTVTARDAMRYLVDNKIRGQILLADAAGTNRAEIIKKLIYRGSAINYVKWTKNTAIHTDPALKEAYPDGLKVGEKAGSTRADGDLLVPEDFGPNNSYLRLGVIEKSRRADIKPADKNAGNQTIIIMDRFPLDIIKHYSLIETAPRELYADHRTGTINWMFRRTDARKLLATKDQEANKENPADLAKVEARQYFYRRPGNRANVISYTNEWTTIGSVSHFSITTPQAFNSGAKPTKELYVESPIALFDDPHENDLKGKPEKLRKFTRNRYVYDETTLGNDGAEQVALALFATWGRDIQTGMVHVPGDPTLEIGEAVQLFNMGLFGMRYDPKANDPKSKAVTYGPEGIHRVESVSHMFAAGGPSKGYTTVFSFGPCDPPMGEAESRRLIETDEQWKAIKGF
jgi:hypothetical protein